MASLHADTLREQFDMNGFVRRLAPILPLSLTIWCGYDAVIAMQQGRTGGAIWEAAKALIFVGVAFLIYDTGKRIPDR